MQDMNDAVADEPGTHKKAISAADIEIFPVQRSAPTATISDEGPEKGGKSGEGGGAPSLPLSNAEFVAHVFRHLPDGARPIVCSKAGDPETGGWLAEAAGDVDRQCPSDRNNYVNCSSFVPGDDGEINARKEQVAAFHFLMLDDIGTKADRAGLNGCTPSWEIETSPGNSQLGFCLKEPISQEATVKALQDAALRAGLGDRGASGIARWARLPEAINGKAKHADEQGKPFHCRLLAWKPDAIYTVAELAKALGLTLFPVSPLLIRPVRENRQLLTAAQRGDDVYTPRAIENPVLRALHERGLYKRAISHGKHDITCPWASEHTDGLDTGAAYFEPSREYPSGGFCCQHSHGDSYHISHLTEHLGLQPGEARWTARIRVIAGEIPRVRRAAEIVLALQGGYYQAGGAIVSIKTHPLTGDISMVQVSEQELTSALAEAADWEKYDGRSQKWVRCDPPVRTVQLLHRAQGYDHLPHLQGLARQPFVREGDGQLVTAPGYDAASGIYASFDPAAFPLPEPTKEAAHAALAKLKELLTEFHFGSEIDRAASISAMLTGAVRTRLQTAPAFNVTASTPGSGKSYLASAITPFAGPGVPLNLSYPTSADEATKSILSMLLQAPAVAVFDDMQTDWRAFGTMNRMLTSSTITDRILGVSKSATVSTRCLILGTGNNVRPVNDMCRRVITIRLTPRSEAPATLRYEGRPVDLVKAKRGEYVAAALTIIRAWEAAGRPKVDVPNIGSFEQWTDHCRYPLLWLGEPDPASSIIDQLRDDPAQEALGHFVSAWWNCFADKPMTVRKVVDCADNKVELRDALEDLPVTERGYINRGKLGWYLKKHAHRIVNGMEIRPADCSERNAWCVAKVAVRPEALTPVSPLLAA
ncbi:hypothetical protein FIL70_12215 [Sphingobium fuliginis ATCC 27551]|uniref:RepB-like DNA primase domain-containing protein n=2 Tax=Sphingobium fuliginis (strain ATCC 27551) TaxID=336203 RepID=A0A5B8CG58_SPHSA|nr:hypothetical protein FIL70_12215 [Sphingobium fuliginis ATCC 27551]